MITVIEQRIFCRMKPNRKQHVLYSVVRRHVPVLKVVDDIWNKNFTTLCSTPQHWTHPVLCAVLDLVCNIMLSKTAVNNGRGQRAIAPPPLNFWLSEIVRKIFFAENFRPKMQNLGLKPSIL